MKKAKKSQGPRTVVFVSAPDIPVSEVKKLRKRWMKDPVFAVNYELQVNEVFVGTDDRLVVIAPDIPNSEREKLEEAAQTQDLIIVNYEVQAFAVPVRPS
jgi:ribosomal protein L30E